MNASKGDGHHRRILFVINEAYFFFTHRLPVAQAAQAAGYDVHVAAPDDHVWAPQGFSLDDLRRLGFTVHEIKLSRQGTNPFSEVVSLLSLLILFARLRPDIVHLLTIKPVLYGGIIARLLGVPAVAFGITGLGRAFVSKGWRAGLMRRGIAVAYRFVCGHANCRVIVQNAGDVETLVVMNCVRRDLIVLIRGSGVAMTEFIPTPEPSGPPLVVLVARLIWEKGVADFAAAARILKSEGALARFALVGDTQPSNPRSVPAATIEGWVEDGILEWWGRRTDMNAVYRECAIVALPTYYGEGVPKALIEAAACARPIVASEISGCREIVKNGENGLLTPQKDPAALAGALRQLIADKELRRSMGARGRARAEAEFSDLYVAERTLEIYDELEKYLTAD